MTYSGASTDFIDKHRLVITVGSAFRSVNIGPTFERLFPGFRDIEFPALFLRPADRLFPLKAGDKLFIDAPDAELNEKLQFRFDIAFGEPLIETLQHMADLIDNTSPVFDRCSPRMELSLYNDDILTNSFH